MQDVAYAIEKTPAISIPFNLVQKANITALNIAYTKLPNIKAKVLAIDPQACIIVSKVDEVGGVGFTLDRVYE